MLKIVDVNVSERHQRYALFPYLIITRVVFDACIKIAGIKYTPVVYFTSAITPTSYRETPPSQQFTVLFTIQTPIKLNRYTLQSTTSYNITDARLDHVMRVKHALLQLMDSPFRLTAPALTIPEFT